MKLSTKPTLVALLSMLLVLPVSAWADEHENDKEEDKEKQVQVDRDDKEKDKVEKDKDKADQDKQKVKKLMTFTLKHRSPQEVRQLVMLCEHGAPGQQVPGQRVVAGFRGTADPSQVQHSKMAIAIDDEKKLVMVRGSEETLEQVKELVDKLDVEDGELQKIELKTITLIPLSSEHAQRANSALSQLQLGNHQLISMGEVTLIALHAGDKESEEDKEKHEQAKEVISKFEKDDKPDDEMEEEDQDSEMEDDE